MLARIISSNFWDQNVPIDERQWLCSVSNNLLAMGSFFKKIFGKKEHLPLTLATKDPLGPEINRNAFTFCAVFGILLPFELNDFY